MRPIRHALHHLDVLTRIKLIEHVLAVIGHPIDVFRGGLEDLVGGQVQIMFTGVSATLPYVKSGRLKALGVSSDKRLALLRELRPKLSRVAVLWDGTPNARISVEQLETTAPTLGITVRQVSLRLQQRALE